MKTKENLLPGQMDIFQLFDTGFGMTTDEKIVKYLFDTKEVCVFAGGLPTFRRYICLEKIFRMQSRKFFLIALEMIGLM